MIHNSPLHYLAWNRPWICKGMIPGLWKCKHKGLLVHILLKKDSVPGISHVEGMLSTTQPQPWPKTWMLKVNSLFFTPGNTDVGPCWRENHRENTQVVTIPEGHIVPWGSSSVMFLLLPKTQRWSFTPHRLQNSLQIFTWSKPIYQYLSNNSIDEETYWR